MLYLTVPHGFPWSPHGVLMESSWSPHNLLKVLMESSWSSCGVSMDSMDSMKTPPKIHRFYGESMDFGWTMISFGEIYPCRSVISHCLLQICFTFFQTHILKNS